MPKGDESKVLLGEPVDAAIDVGLAVRKGQDVTVNVYSGSSVLDAGSPTGETAVVGRVLSPLTRREVGTIRCIGLNVSVSGKWPKREGMLTGDETNSTRSTPRRLRCPFPRSPRSSSSPIPACFARAYARRVIPPAAPGAGPICFEVAPGTHQLPCFSPIINSQLKLAYIRKILA